MARTAVHCHTEASENSLLLQRDPFNERGAEPAMVATPETVGPLATCWDRGPSLILAVRAKHRAAGWRRKTVAAAGAIAGR